MTKIGLPLEGVRVIEYANFVAAPICGRLLADWGAEVIKIEPTFGDTMRFVGIQWCFPTDEKENPMCLVFADASIRDLNSKCRRGKSKPTAL